MQSRLVLGLERRNLRKKKLIGARRGVFRRGEFLCVLRLERGDLGLVLALRVGEGLLSGGNIGVGARAKFFDLRSQLSFHFRLLFFQSRLNLGVNFRETSLFSLQRGGSFRARRRQLLVVFVFKRRDASHERISFRRDACGALERLCLHSTLEFTQLVRKVKFHVSHLLRRVLLVRRELGFQILDLLFGFRELRLEGVYLGFVLRLGIRASGGGVRSGSREISLKLLDRSLVFALHGVVLVRQRIDLLLVRCSDGGFKSLGRSRLLGGELTRSALLRRTELIFERLDFAGKLRLELFSQLLGLRSARTFGVSEFTLHRENGRGVLRLQLIDGSLVRALNFVHLCQPLLLGFGFRGCERGLERGRGLRLERRNLRLVAVRLGLGGRFGNLQRVDSRFVRRDHLFRLRGFGIKECS